MNHCAAQYSDVLVDYSGLSKTLGDLGHSFKPFKCIGMRLVGKMANNSMQRTARRAATDAERW
jgi:hypothetical protein